MGHEGITDFYWGWTVGIVEGGVGWGREWECVDVDEGEGVGSEYGCLLLSITSTRVSTPTPAAIFTHTRSPLDGKIRLDRTASSSVHIEAGTCSYSYLQSWSLDGLVGPRHWSKDRQWKTWVDWSNCDISKMMNEFDQTDIYFQSANCKLEDCTDLALYDRIAWYIRLDTQSGTFSRVSAGCSASNMHLIIHKTNLLFHLVIRTWANNLSRRLVSEATHR